MSVLPTNENERLKALQSYQILDTLSEGEFDRITELASIICNTPIALISLIDANRQWFKSKVGLDAAETARDISFCQHAILDVNLFQVENAMEDERFKDNPLVTGNPNIRFYAGYPLQDPNGYNLGTLCVINQEPQKLTLQQEKALQLLAQEVVANMVNRKNTAQKEQLAKLFDLSLNLMCIATTDGNFVEINQTWEEVLGYVTQDLKGTSFLDLIHPDDIPATLKVMGELSEQNNVINFINRYRAKDGSYKLVEWQASPNGDLIYAVARDVTEIEQNKIEVLKVNSILKEAEKITKMGSWELDLATNNTYWTDEVYAIHEVDKDFKLNKDKAIEFYHPDYQEIITNVINITIKEQIPYDVRCKLITAKGTQKWVRAIGNPVIENGLVTKLRGVFMDITDLVENEEKIAKEQLYSKQLIESMQDGFSVISPDGEQIGVNKAFWI
jgi:PAS domain S-box-containing protein